MKDILLTILRNRSCSKSEFRSASKKLGAILAYETSLLLPRHRTEVDTPLAKFPGSILQNGILIVPILRSGLALLPPFLSYFEFARVGFVGMKRDEETAVPHKYYDNLPTIHPDDDTIILEPMIATGGSVCGTLQFLKDRGVREEKMIVVSIIGATEGTDLLRKEFPKSRLVIAQQDAELNHQKYILPGLGDFGDRYFGTEHP